MSGIYGLFANSKGMDYMKKWNLAYGKDSQDEKVFAECGIGICMEHITTTPINKTPIIHREAYYAAIDAIIYNRDELAKRYNVSLDLSDEQMIFDIVIRYGYDSLAYVNGDFCGAVYEEPKHKLILFRDHMGVRPLFYYKGKEWMSFSSDIRGIIAVPDMKVDVNPEWLYREVSGYDTADMVKTEIADVYEVRPASYIVVNKNDDTISFDEHQYWSLGQKKIRKPSRKAYEKGMYDIIEDSVRRRLNVFPGKVGAELSGGLDSGVIDILINRLGREGIFYSWSFSPEDWPLVGPTDERQVIADICDQEGITCNYGAMTLNTGWDSAIGVNHANLGLEMDPRLSEECNYALPLYINTMIIAETSQFVNSVGGRVVFSGHSGDEGVSNRTDSFELLYHKEYFHFFRQLWLENVGKKNRLIQTIRDYRYKQARSEHYKTNPFNTGNQAQEILKQSFIDLFKDKKMPVLTFNFDAIAYVNSGNTHNRLDVAALLGAYGGARYIFPFTDYRVIDYAVSIPRYLYLNGKQNRYIYRQAFKEIMPASLYTCTDKDNPSTANQEEEEFDWATWVEKRREYLLNSLDRSFWEKYLDYEFLEKWNGEGKPRDDEKEASLKRMRKLAQCFQFQCMMKRARKK